MNFIKKINRGLILTVFVLILVAVYLLATFLVHINDRAEIKDLLDKYVSEEAKMYIMPENLSELTPEEVSNKEESIVGDTKNALKPYYVENEQTYASLAEIISSYQIRQATEKDTDINFLEAKLVKISNISFSGDTATVKATVQINYDFSSSLIGRAPYDKGTTKDTRKDENTYTFQKENNTWKLFYSSGVNLNSYGGYEMGMPYEKGGY